MKKLFIFGSTGDLVKRKVIPALRNFKDLEIIALGRKNLLKKQSKKITSNLKNSKYFKINFSDELIDCLKCKKYLNKKEINYFYVSIPPENIIQVINFLGNLKKEGYNLKALIEKPFGNSLNEAKILLNKIKKENLYEEIFLSDHYLFKENFLKIEKSNYSKLKIVSLETLGIENRLYYNNVGAIKDMVQGHFINMVYKIIPEKSLKNLKIYSIKTEQYSGYENEIGKKSTTETYAKITLKNLNLEIKFETGKKSKSKESYISLDGKKISLIDSSNPYTKIFKDFFSNNKENFPTLEKTIKAWKITEKILKKSQNII